MAAEAGDELIDDDIIEIFVEEAQEVLAVINEQFPVWRAEPGNAEVRLEIRRAFHTLKGSGRMVKASFISELTWSVENMMNRITDGTVTVSESMFSLIDQVRGVLPDLIKAFQHRADAPVDIAPMMQCADALSRGESLSAVGAAANLPATTTASPAEPETPAMGQQALSEEEMQQLNDRLDALAGQLDALQQGFTQLHSGMQGMQADVLGLQQRPQVSPATLEQLGNELTAAKSGIAGLQGNIKAALARIDHEASDLRGQVTRLHSNDGGLAELRAVLDAELKALRREQGEAGRAANTLATVAVGVGLVCIGLVLFFHMVP